ncbi:transcription factor TFIIIB component B'' homolog isoform X7 [Takifugu rubripes]|uniref:transcription factor TFIIIB component B'' homolog isoform X7 n=1 Tax=Takifugu rubripes TaxID=31033 RepID=UPI0011456733|nr:transcription factor TFIIIB component B'' homolog isoform X7 [Takifugu rubripes]
MFRRSRFSVRPNVGAAGRTAAAPQEAPPVNQNNEDTSKITAPSDTDTAVAEKSATTPSENPSAQGDGSDQIADTSSAAVQRRKRFSVKPKVVPGRPSVLARTAKSPVKADRETPLNVPGKAEDGTENASQSSAAAAPRELPSTRRRRPSEDSQQSKIQPKPQPVPSDSSAAATEDLRNRSHQPADAGERLETTSDCQVKESPFKVPEKVPPSLPRKDVSEISERAKMLVSSKIGRSTSAASFSLSRLLNDPSDLHRLAKARKLRELLKEEAHKEKRLKRSKWQSKEFTLDPAKMTMRDLIHYLPESNPMNSCLEVAAPEDESVVSPFPEGEDPPERAQEPAGSQRDEGEDEDEEAADGDQDEALLVPQVKVAEDGSLIIDESSLTVEVQRAKGPNLIQDRDPIFERGSTTTYSSFRKGSYSKPWSNEETDMFFLAVSMVGTDFTMICQLFPHRARSEIKNKFKKEERQNSWRVDKAFRERRKLDIEYFSKLLEMILEVQKNRKKHRSLAQRNGTKKRKGKGKKAQKKLSDVEEEEEDEIPDLEEEEDDEDEDLCSESQAAVSPPKKQRKMSHGQEATTDERGRHSRDNGEQDKVCIPEAAEASPHDDDASTDRPVADPTASEDAAVKPDKPSPGRAARPLPRLDRKCVKKPPAPSTTSKNNTSGEADVTGNDAATDECKKRKADDVSSDEEATKCQPLKPTRYGRMPKPTKPLTYPTKEDALSSPSEAPPASPTAPSAPRPKSKCPAKKKGKASVQEPKRPKLITLRASQSEYSDDDGEENQEWAGPQQQLGCASSGDSAAAFVPASLCSLHPLSVEVEETMEELDILASMPDVFGISQDALCSDVKTVENETCSAEPREHQLDLLVDVIDCLPSEYTVSEEESYNEAAQTLLAIGNLAPGATSAENHSALKAEAVSEGERTLETDQGTASMSDNREMATHGVAGSSESVGNTEPQSSLNDNGHAASAGDQKTETPQLPPSAENSEQISSQAKPRRTSKIKPNPVLRTSRAVRSKTQADTPPGSVESNAAAPSSSETTEIPSATEVNKTEMSQNSSSNEICEGKVPEAAAGSLEKDASTGMETSLEPMTTDEIVTPGTSESAGLASDKPATDASVSDPNMGDDSAASQKEEGRNALHTRKRRFQKAKPNLPTTPRAARSRFQTTQGSASTPDPELKSAETDISSPGSRQDLGSDSLPSETGLTAEKKTEPERVRQLLSSVAASDQITVRTQEATTELGSTEAVGEQIHSHMGEKEPLPEPAAVTSSDPSASCPINREDPAVCQRGAMESSSTNPVRKGRFQKVRPKPNLVSIARSVRSNPTTSNPPSTPRSYEATGGQATGPPAITSPVRIIDGAASGSGLLPTPDTSSSVTAPQDPIMTEAEQTGVGVEGQAESSVDPSTSLNKDLPVTQEGTATTCPTRKGQRLKPNLPQTSRRARCKPQSAEEPVAATLVEKPLSCDVSASQNDQISSAGPAGTPDMAAPSATSQLCPVMDLTLAEDQGKNVGSSECPAKHEPQRRRRFAKAKPNFGSSARNVPAKLPPSDTSKASEQHHEDTQILLPPTERDGEHSMSTGKSGDSQNDEVMASHRVATAIHGVAHNRSARTDSDTPSDDAADVSQVRHPENVSAGTEMKSVRVEPSPGVKESPQQACSERKSGDPHTSGTAKATSVTQSRRGDQSEPVAFAKALAVLARRGRLVRPKPNLGPSSRSKQSQILTQREGDCSSSDAQVSTQRPIGGAVEQENPAAGASSEVLDHVDQPHAVAGPPLGSLDEVSYTQDLTTSSAAGHQIPADFMLSEMLSGQVPADPDETFFILSLTEIPLCSLREMGDSTSEPLLPVAELSQQQQSVSEESLGEPPAQVVVSIKEGGLVTVGGVPPDPAAHKGSDLDNPVDPHESVAVEASTSPAAERRPPRPRRRHGQSTAAAKQHQRKKRGRGASELPGPLPEPEGHLRNVTPGGGTDAKDARSAAGTTLTRTTRLRASSHGSPCDEHKHSAVSPPHSIAKTAAAQQDTASAPPPAPPPPAEEDAELISDTEENDGTEQPPTGVSQYFLSDIFTEVEDE